MIETRPIPTNHECEFSREHPEPAVAESPLAIDRRRVVTSSAFRRLQHKAQVFIAAETDHFRTRMTHTLEVADAAREIARACGAREDLAEVVALAHDLGHPPFGHAGERALDACMAEHGGFEHNAHSLRVVELLEHPYPGFRGLNLTRVVRECLAKHSTRFDAPGSHLLQDGRPAPIEGQIAALADTLAYTLHDLQDGVHAGLLTNALLLEFELWRESYAGPAATADAATLRRWLRPTIDEIRRRIVADIAQRSAGSTIALSPAMRGKFEQLANLLLARVYRDAMVRRRDRRGAKMLAAVFGAYVAKPTLLPERFARRVAEQGLERVVADYVAGMTDRFCRREFRRLGGSDGGA